MRGGGRRWSRGGSSVSVCAPTHPPHRRDARETPRVHDAGGPSRRGRMGSLSEQVQPHSPPPLLQLAMACTPRHTDLPHRSPMRKRKPHPIVPSPPSRPPWPPHRPELTQAAAAAGTTPVSVAGPPAPPWPSAARAPAPAPRRRRPGPAAIHSACSRLIRNISKIQSQLKNDTSRTNILTILSQQSGIP